MRSFLVISVLAAFTACAGGDSSADAAGAAPDHPEPVETASPSPVAATASAGRGTATVSLVSDDVSVTGEYPATLCGGPYIAGEGFAYQTRADDWQITVASEERTSGAVPLDAGSDVNVVATANGPGRQFARGPGSGGAVTISDDFRRAEARLELRGIVDRRNARLEVTFTCD